MKKFYRIGKVKIEVEMPEKLQIPKNMELFEIANGTAQDGAVQRKYKLEVVNVFPDVEKEFRRRNPEAKEIVHPDIRILYSAEQEYRELRFAGAEESYAIHFEEDAKYTRIWIDRQGKDLLQYDTIFLSLFGLEKEMICGASLVFHSAYISKDDEAILFSAPSETGKSTQAALWEQYRGARVVNGDRSLLMRENEKWYAYGWPICGSSEICHNETYPIRAIVMLYQAKENVIRKLKGAEAVKKVISQTMINMWNKEFITATMDLVQQLVMEVPVYELGCNISEDAVKCLESVL